MNKPLVGRYAILSAVFLFAMITLTTADVHAVTLFGVNSTGSLVRFDSTTPGTLVTVGPITGLQGGETVLGIDVRPATGQLYALGSTGRLYVLNRASGAATLIASLNTALSGTTFGVDFNPVPDRLRVISNTGQNLRINPNDGVTITDTAINGATTNVDSAAYINNFNGTTTTTLFDISAATDTLYQQNPPNNGTLVAVGPLGVNVSEVTGFDFSSSDNTAYAALTVGGSTGLYTINTTTGAATLVGAIGAGTSAITGLAADLAGTPGFTAVGLTTANQLVTFNASRPGTIQTTVAITGLQAGENILGIDFRPANGVLYGLGSTSRLYSINFNTGAATQIGAAGAFTLSGTDFGFDFNPVPDRLRVVSNTGQNLRLNPNDGTLTATDGTINPGTPTITAGGYTNSFPGTTTTTLYTVDSTGDTLNIQNPPNNGTQVAVGPLGINVSSVSGLDIHPSGNVALAAFQIGAETTSKLFSINLTTGAATFIGPIGAATNLRGLALMPGTAASGRTSLDFDGDAKAEQATYRLSSNSYLINRSSNNSFYSYPFGLASDVQTPADYDGDSLADTAVWRATNGFFYVLRSSDATVQAYQFGISSDEPIARDYDGDRKADFAVVRRTGGQMVWYINNSNGNTFRIETFGLDTDATSPGDFDGDGRFDLGTFRGVGASPATFFMQRSTLGFAAQQWGNGADSVVLGDYDGDARTDLAVVQGGTNMTWLVLRSSNGSFFSSQFGVKPDFITQADYDGDGRTDISVWRGQNAVFYTLRSATGTVSSQQFGQNGDYPIANYDTH
ncbi:MAG TPA: DUF4394 domain-containing protein [Pyrinomonadaceae bacterium]|nr:DUF4394 domain-containing protein [Pyrinomonadaceae bacterium]